MCVGKPPSKRKTKGREAAIIAVLARRGLGVAPISTTATSGGLLFVLPFRINIFCTDSQVFISRS
jgi:hypothetical protein